MRDVTTRLYVVSTYETTKTEKENFKALLKEQQFLGNEGIPTVIAEGRYKGQVEKSLVATADNNAEKFIRMIANTYNQESYLVVYSDKAAELVYKNGKRVNIGKWVKTEDLTLSGLTIFEGNAYTVK